VSIDELFGRTPNASLEALCLSLENCMQEFHAKKPKEPGLARAELVSGWGRHIAPKLVHCAVERLIRKKRLEQADNYLRLPGFSNRSHQDAHSDARQALLQAYTRFRSTPPNIGELIRQLGLSEASAEAALKDLCQAGELVRVSKEIYYLTAEAERLRCDTVAWLKKNRTITPAQFREMSGLSRKYAVALLEYFDRIKTTMRVGDERCLRRE